MREYTLFVAASDILFSVATPLGITIRTTEAYWHSITTIKHPSIGKYAEEVKETLRDPDSIRLSRKDPRVHLYYRNIGSINICVVADHEKPDEGYIVTAYLTDRIKEGEEIYGKD